MFSPTGPSMMVQTPGKQKQVIELTTGVDAPAVRIVSTVHPNSTAWTMLAFGDASVDVTEQTGMPVDLCLRKEVIVPVDPEAGNMAVLVNTSGMFTLYVTPGKLV